MQTQNIKKIIDCFSENIPYPKSKLFFNSDFELLVAVILSAQCTDERVNMVTPSLFNSFGTPFKMSNAKFEDVLSLIKTITYPNNKSKYLIEMAKKIMNDFDGKVPSNREKLMKLQGVGRKTANVVMSICHKAQVMPVDTHVFRVSKRIGFTTNSKNHLQCEKKLMTIFKKYDFNLIHNWLILFGRDICKARNPQCENCYIKIYCQYFRKIKNRIIN